MIEEKLIAEGREGRPRYFYAGLIGGPGRRRRASGVRGRMIRRVVR